MPQTVTRAVESDLETAAIYNVMADGNNIPKWAPVFADAVERIDDTHFTVTKDGEKFKLEVLLHPSACAVDYLRDMRDGRRGGAYIRVTSRPLGGSTVVMTVPLGPNADEDQVAKTVQQELGALVQLAQS
jgi:hypothetical protein